MASSPLPGPNDILLASPSSAFQPDALSQPRPGHANLKPNQVGQVILYGIPIVSLVIDGQERLCLAQISNTLLKNFSYNEIHNRRVALGITCVQCTPVQLEILRRAGAMPISSRRCGMITKREAERLCKSFLGENRPPKLPDNFAFDVSHECAWGCRGSFIPARYNSSRAKCIKCSYCNMYFSPNKFIFHSHRTPDAKYTQPDAANFNSWRRHLKLTDKSPQDELVFAWEDVKAMFNGGSRKRALPQPGAHPACHPLSSVKAAAVAAAAAVAGGGGLLGPHLLGAPPPPPPPPPLTELAGAPHAHHKRPRFDDDDDSLQEAAVVAAASLSAAAASLSVAAASGGAGAGGGGAGGGCVTGVGAGAGAGSAAGAKGPRSYPVIPVPSKGSFGGMLQKFPGCGGLFPHPYTFPAAAAAFGLCHKKEDAGAAAEALGAAGGAGAAPKAGLSGLFWPAGRKDAFYPPFCMFWPPRTPGGLPVPTYLQPPPQPPSALGCALGESPTLLRQAFLDLAEPGGAGGSADAAPPPGQPPPVVANGPGSGPQPPAGGAGARDALFESPPGGSGGDCSAGSTPPADPGAVPGAGAAVAGAGPAGSRVPGPHHSHLLEGRKAGGGSYHHSSAFRPVGGKDDAESLAKLHGASAGAPHSTPAHHHHHHHHPHHHHHHHPPQPPSPLLLLPPQPDEPGSERHHPAPPPPPPPPPPLAPQPHHRGLLSPGGTSCSYPSEDSSENEEDEEEEQEVDVEGHKPPEGEEEEEEGRDPDDDEEEDEETRVLLGDPLVGGGRFLQSRGLSEKGSSRDRAPAASGAFPLALNSSRLLQEDGKLGDPGGSDLPPPPPPPLASQKASGGSSSSPGSPVHHPSLEEQPSYKDNQKTKENNQVILSTKDDNNFSDKNKEHSFFITDPDASGGDFWRERSGEHTQETNSPHSLKKDVENMGKEELQKVLFEQIDLRRRLEQEFQVLKGNTSFPVFNNFQDQMKRELAYREEMVQQLQIIPYAASLIRKEKLGAHLSKS
uniref:SKI family transcriptional corepressor 2 n=1 Tax=Equus caballus TaxID=9796 RepID=A0A3Q2HFT3_HORSE|nr:SKI family transcriptional corepressor 2 [Equus caballus]XP_023503530.1 SKI family transcriptional corepressor 2 [Equus caballus]XP_023503531.1 SKI family transcriptional corepressor 2 [Equus caballus]